MGKIKYLTVLLLAVIIVAVLYTSITTYEHQQEELKEAPTIAALKTGTAKSVKLTVVYDNNPYDEQLKPEHGFGCFINVDGVGILFDTGGDGETLLSNMAKLKIDVNEVDVIVLSHKHGDHVGGLTAILNLNNNVTVYALSSFSTSFKNEIQSYKCELVEVIDAVKITEGVATTGELGGTIKEQSLLINTPQGIVVVTGCAHPGIVNVVREAKRLTDMEIHLIIGGYHLEGGLWGIGGSSESEITSIIQQFETLNVKKIAPGHCSGNLARDMFKQAFAEKYIGVGVGKTIEI